MHVLQENVGLRIHDLRGALLAALAGASADPTRPQEMSRRLGLDKSLAWKISRVVQSTDSHTAMRHMPGDAGFDILLQALLKAKVEVAGLKRVKASLDAYRATVRAEIGDKPTVELVIDALPGGEQSRLAVSRKLAFRGNSGIWGVQARVRVNTLFLAPNAEDPTIVDAAQVGGWVDFRRVREDAEWVLFRRSAYHHGGVPNPEEPIDQSSGDNQAMLMRAFCSAGLPLITAIPDQNKMAYVLGKSQVGNSGIFSCFFGSIIRKLGSAYATREDKTADFTAMISAPVENLLFDLVIHKDCPFKAEPEINLFGMLQPNVNLATGRDRLPIAGSKMQLGGRPPVMATPLVGEYAALTSQVYERCSWNPADFTGLRYQLEYPPFPSTVIMSLKLPERP